MFAAGEVAFIMAIGAILEEMTTNRARKGLRKLISLTPTQGRKITDGKEEMISAEEIRQGDTLRILPLRFSTCHSYRNHGCHWSSHKTRCCY